MEPLRATAGTAEDFVGVGLRDQTEPLRATAGTAESFEFLFS